MYKFKVFITKNFRGNLSYIFVLFFLINATIINAQIISATRFSDSVTTTYSCDGIDDHIQINQALDFVKDNGGVVELSSDTFIIDAALQIAGNNTTLKGVGMNLTTIKLKDNAGWSYYYQENNEWIIHETGPMIFNKKEAMQNITLRDFKIDGNKYNQSIFNPITGQTIQNTVNSHVFDGQGHYIAVDFETRNGSTESIANILFSHVFIYENSDDGFVVQNGTNITVENCKGIRGGHSLVYMLDPVNLTVKDCDFMVTSNSGIRWYDGNHITIKNNHIYGEPEKTGNSNFCIQLTSGQSNRITDDLIIANNRLEFTAGAAIALDAKESASAKNFIIKNNIILQCGNSVTAENIRETGGINLKNVTNTLIENNTIVNCIGGGIRLGGNVGFNTEWTYETGLTAIIKNNIITNTIQGGNSSASGYGIDIASGNSAICTFNNLWANATGNYFGTNPDKGNISIDPLFKHIILGGIFSNTNDTTADLHLKSEMGRWNNTSAIWENDANSSVCINGGDPNLEYSNEPSNNGNRLNLGAYGNTIYASKGIKAPPVANAGEDQYIRDDDNDGIVFVNLDGSLSVDDAAITSFSWERNGGVIATTEINNNVPFVVGEVNVTLTITDNDGIISTDNTLIKILPYGTNINPIANAGNDIVVTDNDNDLQEIITLNGELSNDPDAIITNYVWSENGIEIGTEKTVELYFSVGLHLVTLTVTDNEGATDSNDVVVEVKPKGNYALEFSNDFNDEVVITDNISFNSPNFTIEMWVKQTATTGDAILLWLGGDGKRIMLKNSTSNPSWDATTSNTTLENVSLNTWHHLAYVVENGNLNTIYIDGNPTTINDPVQILMPTDLNIGSFYGTTDAFESNFTGVIDELRYWNTARTITEINDNKDQELVGNEIGLKAYWNFNDGSGKRLTDEKGIADGTLYNMENEDWVDGIPFGNTVNSKKLYVGFPSINIYPNPASLLTNIEFYLTDSTMVNIDFYTLDGKKIEEVVNEKLYFGDHTIIFDTSKLNSGTYFFKIKINDKTTIKNLVIN